MPIKVILPVDKTDVTTSGLFQWDYGQTLEIETAELGTEVVEVHFACSDMSEAIVYSCSFLNGVGTVHIPDRCLEQTSTISAWIYRINATRGYTWKVIHLPVTGRTRPSVNREIPHEVSDKYTQLISEINEMVDALEEGDVTAAKAQSATNANYATSAGNAANANHAVSADGATTASKAVSLMTTLVSETMTRTVSITAPGLYAIDYGKPDGSNRKTALFYIPTLYESVYGEYAGEDICICYSANNHLLSISEPESYTGSYHHFYSVRAIALV